MNDAELAFAAPSSHQLQIIGQTASIQALRQQIAHLVTFDTVGNPHVPTIFLRGETGTGKGLVARTIHEMGPRARGPFIDINCGAIPDTLIEAELFGFESGAFTDAKRGKAGLFEAASGGVLFLDEIDALPLSLQGTLLKAIEEKRIRRLGSTSDYPVDVKLIVATKEDLNEWVEAGRFRADLYHRLAVIILPLPPLRDRGDDVVVLAQHFLQQYAQAHGLVGKTLSVQAQDWLRGYRWPGNIRELSHTMERVTLLSSDPSVEVATLEQFCGPQLGNFSPAELESARQPDVVLGEPERIRQALVKSGGNIAQAARFLGLTRNTLRYRMRRHRIERPLLDEPEPGTSRAKDLSQVPELHSHSPEIASPQWEQKPVAVLAIELTFSQPATESALPLTAQSLEPWSLAAQWEQLITNQFEEFGGLYLRHTPSVFIALFGVPQTLEQMPQRALHTAFAVQRLVRDAGAPDAVAPVVRLVVHHGMVLVNLKDDTSLPMALGETFALPTRLLGHTNPGEILASAHVGRQLSTLSELMPRKVQLGTDASDWVEAYSVVRELDSYGTVNRRRFGTLFVGREREIEGMQEQWTASVRGKGQVAGLVGEPGMGKSRLLAEFRRRYEGEGGIDGWMLEGACRSYGNRVPYLPVIDLVRQCCDILPTDDTVRMANKLDATLQDLGVDLNDTAPYLYHLLGLQHQSEELRGRSSDAIKKRTFSALHQLFVGRSQQRPVLMVVEDLQWIDNTSESFFTSLIERLPGISLFFVATYRPGYRPPWIERSGVTQTALRPLSVQDSEDLVEALLDSALANLAEEERVVLIRQAEGNPLFLEELVYAMISAESRDTGVVVPDTIQGVLMARIDRLKPAQKQLLQTASILGREVSHRLLESLWESSESIMTLLPALQHQEFLYEQIGSVEPGYVFKHALTQEVVYESVSLNQRQALHKKAGETLEQLSEGSPDTVDDWLAYHYARSLDTAKAVQYLSRAADKAAHRHAHPEAISLFREAIPHAEALPLVNRDRVLVELILRQAFSLSTVGQFRVVADLLLPYQAAVDALQEPTLSGPFYFRLALNSSFLNQYDRVVQYAGQAIEAAQQCGDRATLGKAYYALATKAFWGGDFRQAAECGQAAVGLLDEASEQSWAGLSHFILGMTYAGLGEFSRALDATTTSLRVAEELDDARLKCFASYGLGWIHSIQGREEQGLQSCQLAIEYAPDPFSKALSSAFLGVAYLYQGKPVEAIPSLEWAIQVFDRIGIRQTQGQFIITLGEARYLTGALDAGQVLVLEGQEMCQVTQKPYGLGHAARVLGQIALSKGEMEAAERYFREALQLFTAMSARYEMARIHLLMAELGAQQGREELSRACLVEAYSLFKTMAIPKYITQAEGLAQQLNISFPPPLLA